MTDGRVGSEKRLASSLWIHLIPIGLGLLAFVFAFRPIFAVDTFWHLALGAIIDAEGIPYTDRFSAVHPDKPWVQFQWLWEWAAFRIVDMGGFEALRLANATLFAFSTGFLFHVLRKHAPISVALLLSTLFLALCIDRMRVRPDAMNVLFFVLGTPLVLGGWRALTDGNHDSRPSSWASCGPIFTVEVPFSGSSCLAQFLRAIVSRKTLCAVQNSEKHLRCPFSAWRARV